MSNATVRQFLVFLIVGSINTVFGYSIFCLFIFLKMHYVLASLLATIMGIIFNFRTTGRIVFKSMDNTLFLRFLWVYVALYLINISLIKGCSYFVDNFYMSGAIAIFGTAIVGFFLNKYLVFQSSFSRAKISIL